MDPRALTLGDLTESPDPIEIKLFSTDTPWLMIDQKFSQI
jgi:hypothetical protein